MVSFNVYKPASGGAYVEGVCLTSDTKPIAGIANGSILFAVNTSDGSMKKYMFNQSAAAWVEVHDYPGQTLPEVDSDDNGKLLGVSSGKWAAIAAPTELPEVDSGDNGKLLGVSGGEWAAIAAPTELPSVGADDNGKVLTVVDGAWAAVTPSAGE